MKIKLGKTEYHLNFGVGFIRELDSLYSYDVEGVEFGTGVNQVWLKLQSQNPYILYQVLHAALRQDIDLTESQFDEWVDSLESEKEYSAFFKELLKTLETQRQTGTLIKTFKETMNKMVKETAK